MCLSQRITKARVDPAGSHRYSGHLEITRRIHTNNSARLHTRSQVHEQKRRCSDPRSSPEGMRTLRAGRGVFGRPGLVRLDSGPKFEVYDWGGDLVLHGVVSALAFLPGRVRRYGLDDGFTRRTRAPRPTRHRRGHCPGNVQCSEGGLLLLGELAPPRFGVRDPHAQPDGHRLGFAVDRDLFGVAARDRPVRAFPFHPLLEGREATLECSLRLARALRRTRSRRGGRRCLNGLDAQPGQPFLLLGGQ